jgi:hypothetical protein
VWYIVCSRKIFFGVENETKSTSSAGLFWASEATVAMGYPEASKRGKYLK